MNRNHTVTNHLGELISFTQIDLTWEDIRDERRRWFKVTDLWYLKDRWDGLSSVRKGELNSFRQEMRELPQTYNTANDAMDNFPEPQEWFE